MQEAAKSKQIKYDVDGYDIITNALKDLLNSFPGLLDGETIKFSTLEEDSELLSKIKEVGIVTSITTKITDKTIIVFFILGKDLNFEKTFFNFSCIFFINFILLIILPLMSRFVSLLLSQDIVRTFLKILTISI